MYVEQVYEDIKRRQELANELEKKRIGVRGNIATQDMSDRSKERIAVLKHGAKHYAQKAKRVNELKKERKPAPEKKAKFRATVGQKFIEDMATVGGMASNIRTILDTAPQVTINWMGDIGGKLVETAGEETVRSDFRRALMQLANMKLGDVNDSQPAVWQVMRQIKSSMNEDIESRQALFNSMEPLLADAVNNLASDIHNHELAYREMGMEPGVELQDAREIKKQLTNFHTYVRYVNSLDDRDDALPYSTFLRQSQENTQPRSAGATGSF
jgi:hypothetical protein